MPTVIVAHRVQEFDAWKSVFEKHAGSDRLHGVSAHRVFRAVGDPNQVIVTYDFDSLDSAEAFMSDPALAKDMERAGVEGPAEIYVGEEVESASY